MVQQSGSVRDQRASIIDEFGECQRQIRLFAPVLQREQVLRKIIAAWYANADPETGASCDGDVYRVNVGPKARTRIVNCQKLYSVLGEAYWDNAEYPLRVLDTLVIDMTGIISEERTGSRTVQSVLREARPRPQSKKQKKSNLAGVRRRNDQPNARRDALQLGAEPEPK